MSRPRCYICGGSQEMRQCDVCGEWICWQHTEFVHEYGCSDMCSACYEEREIKRIKESIIEKFVHDNKLTEEEKEYILKLMDGKKEVGDDDC